MSDHPDTLQVQENEGNADHSPEDLELIRQAREELSRQCYLRAAQVLRRVSNPELLSPRDRCCLKMAEECENILHVLQEAPLDQEGHPDHGWVQQEETHSDHFDAQIFYRVDRNHEAQSSAISCRIESPIEQDLLVPLLAVLNESEFYASWMPHWRHPVRLGVKSCTKLREMDRGNQLIAIQVDMPFPFKCRECFMHAYSADDIDDSRSIIIRVRSVDSDPGEDLDDSYCGSKVPLRPDRNVVRIDFNAGFLIRKCPSSHRLLQKAKHRYTNPLLLSVTQQMNAHVGLVPMSMINFFTKSVVGKMWQTLLTIAEEIRDGKRQEHAKAIQEKEDLYDWIRHRVQVLLQEEDGSERSKDFMEVGLESTEMRL